MFLWYLILSITLALNLSFLSVLMPLFRRSPVYLHYFLVWSFFSYSLNLSFPRVIQFFLLPIPHLRHLFCSCSFNQYICVSHSDFWIFVSNGHLCLRIPEILKISKEVVQFEFHSDRLVLKYKGAFGISVVWQAFLGSYLAEAIICLGMEKLGKITGLYYSE